VDTRSPPGHPLGTSSLNQIRFLRYLYHNEPQEVLAACTKLIYVRIPSSTRFIRPALSFPLAHLDGNIDIARVLRDSDALYLARVLGLPHPCSRKGKIGAVSENGTEQ